VSWQEAEKQNEILPVLTDKHVSCQDEDGNSASLSLEGGSIILDQDVVQGEIKVKGFNPNTRSVIDTLDWEIFGPPTYVRVYHFAATTKDENSLNVEVTLFPDGQTAKVYIWKFGESFGGSGYRYDTQPAPSAAVEVHTFAHCTAQ
jgi:hypothetical protein